MKTPKLAELKIDRAGTKNLRARLGRTKHIKITIRVDAGKFRSLSTISGRKLPAYYRLIGQLLKTKLDDIAASRLDRIERELKKLKRQIAA